MPQRGFSGSYPADWVNFLLNTVSTEMTPVEEKERLIQSGEKHYSDMLSEEPEPSEFHLELYQGALETGSRRLAGEVMALAKALINNMPNQDIVLVSLVRAGVPLGVLLHLALKKLGVTSFHYGISIIRDRGIDDVAMKQIEQQHGTQGTVFVDGWTGKGAITQELRRSLSVRPGYPEQDRLVVLADVCGSAWLSASTDDWLIPFGILGAPVSGLISRSIWSAADYHGSVRCDHLAKFDRSISFIETVTQEWDCIDIAAIEPAICDDPRVLPLLKLSQDTVTSLADRYKINNLNRIKPGIAEATRAVLRRLPDHVLVRSRTDKDVSLLMYLTEKLSIPVQEVGEAIAPYRAITIIKKVGKE
ncbi:cysteine protease StiP family protein [Budvicia aquatica]|uniref:cysteine protease StiP family protein n=1 Tax=Budvicia aquatica TaxID=82979 RepID=UPI00207F8EFC|nr:cysteine protease StiP family protein [Budvicia aquatica]GKX50292.1 hypothetical protein SOASR029_06010 [Budvicia aquatica]